MLCSWTINASERAILLPVSLADKGSDWVQEEASGVVYVRPATNLLDGAFPGSADKLLTFQILFPQAGVYEVYAKIRVGSGAYNDDSFFMAGSFGSCSAVTAGDWHMVNGLAGVGFSLPSDYVTGGGTVGSQVWKWINVSEFINPTHPITYSVSEPNSSVLFQVGSREDGLDIAALAFAQADLSYTVANLEYEQAGVDPSSIEDGYPKTAFQQVETFQNPVLPGDHPDITLFKHGDDFYACTSSFHFTPYCQILHSTDLIHWRVLSRAVSPTWSGLLNDGPGAGIWQGAVTYFYGSWWIYFSNTAGGGQYVAKASTPEGPWSTPVKVANATGYDNSVFVDEDGTPYMLMKNGKYVNRIQALATNGQLTGTQLNLDWMNADGQYSWAEGPVMCKRNGWYYYFIAGNVGGGQWVLRSRTLTDAPAAWEELGAFFESVSDPETGFRAPNHLSQPFEIADGTWWALSHSYESLGSDDWGGRGRQGLLHSVVWDLNGKPIGVAPSSKPLVRPNLPLSTTPLRMPRSDSFERSHRDVVWHFLNRAAATKSSTTTRAGWLTLSAFNDSAHVLQKEAGRSYALVTRVDARLYASGQEAGLYVCNGNESRQVKLVHTFTHKSQLRFSYEQTSFVTDNIWGDTVWLKLERNQHALKAYASKDGMNWQAIGNSLSVETLDASQDNYNSWVGNSIGLFARKVTAHFDLFLYRDAASGLLFDQSDQLFGMQKVTRFNVKGLSPTSDLGGWMMFAGVDFGWNAYSSLKMELSVAASATSVIEIWLDAIEQHGTLIAEVEIPAGTETGTLETRIAEIDSVHGQHDVYVRLRDSQTSLFLHQIRWLPQTKTAINVESLPSETLFVGPNPSKDAFCIQLRGMRAGSIESYRLYDASGKLLETGALQHGMRFGADLPSGVYVFKCQLNNVDFEQKLIKR